MASSPLPREDLEEILAQTGGLWAQARGQSFFITGGTGFFGMWLLESFAHANDALQLGMRAVVLTRDPAAFALKAPHLAGRADLGFHAGDLRTFAFPAGHFDCLIHAAADTAIWTKGEQPDGLLDRIRTGIGHLLDFTAHAGVKKFLLVSSGAVYGNQPAGVSHVPEDFPGVPDPRLPGSIWGEGKCVAEQLCRVRAGRIGCELKIARCFAFVGPHLPLDHKYAIGNFIGDVLAGRPIKVTGDGTAVRSYLYAGDLAAWLWTILFRGAPGRAYNVGSPDGRPIIEVARQVADVLHHAPGVAPVASVPAGGTVSVYVPDVRRAAQELQLERRVPLGAAIQKTAAWCGWRNTQP